MNVVPLDPDGHSSVQLLLPWYVTGRLDESERAELELHLAGCARCRAELALERELHATQALPGAVGDAERGLASMRQRIAGAKSGARRPAVPWWRWALGAQFALILLLLVVLAAPRFEGERYRGLGGAGASANAVVMFRPEATEAQIREALRASGARLVGGPTATQAYLLSLPQADAAALARLRAQPAVTLAESLDAAGRP